MKPIDKLNTEMIRDTFEKVRSVYNAAYSWEPPMDHVSWDNTARIRQHIKRWITEWDLRRLYPDYKPEIETFELKQNLSEMQDLEQPNEDSLEERQAPTEQGE